MLKPFEWKDRPALIEHLFPVQKISAESYKEQMAGAGKTLTALGSHIYALLPRSSFHGLTGESSFFIQGECSSAKSTTLGFKSFNDTIQP